MPVPVPVLALDPQALSFLKTLFEKWNAQSVTHSVSVVFTCRTMLGKDGWSRRFSAAGLEGRAVHSASPFLGAASSHLPPGLKRMPDGRLYEDFYVVWLHVCVHLQQACHVCVATFVYVFEVSCAAYGCGQGAAPPPLPFQCIELSEDNLLVQSA